MLPFFHLRGCYHFPMKDRNTMKVESQARRAHNRKSSEEILKMHRISFVSKNFGAHLIVSNGTKTVDFWPGTGLWRDRANGENNGGVNNLCRYMK